MANHKTKHHKINHIVPDPIDLNTLAVDMGGYVKQTADLLCIVNSAGDVLWTNPAFDALDDVRPMSFLERVHPDDQPDCQFVTGTTFECRYYDSRRADYRWYMWEVCQLDAADHHFLHGRDADEFHTLRNRVEELAAHHNETVKNIRASFLRIKDHVEAILNNTSDAILLVTDEGRIDQTNPAFNKMFDYEPDELFNQPVTRIFAEINAEEISHALHDALDMQDANKRIEAKMLRKDGMTFDADIAVGVFVDANTQETSFVISVRDITERKLAERELLKTLEKERELNELKSRFVSVVSHEFRTPLAVILASSGLVQSYFDRLTPENRTHHLSLIETQVKHLRDLIDDVLSITQAETVGLTFNPIQANLYDLCRDVINTMQLTAKDSHQIHLNTNGVCQGSLIDVNLMRRVMMNLLSNAIKYSPEGGDVRVDVMCGDDEAIIRVQDSGIGIPKEDQARLFKTFQRARNVEAIKGTGLGLMIVKQAIEAHGGEVLLESAVGQGTTITIHLPLRHKA